MSKLLSHDRITEFCGSHSRWTHEQDALIGKVQAPTFTAAIEFVVQVAKVAEDMNHHPDITIQWRTVTFQLSTHSVGGITELDTQLAERIDAIVVTEFGSSGS